jgi:glycosyltransferase involved in cell wall biosynthesis
MASRRPVVVTNVGGNPEIVRGGVDGLLVPRGDSHAIARALLDVLADPSAAHQMGEAGRKRVTERFALQNTIEKYSRRYTWAAARLRGHAVEEPAA